MGARPQTPLATHVSGARMPPPPPPHLYYPCYGTGINGQMKLNGGITFLIGQRFRLTIKLSASTGKEYCESTGKCNSKVKVFTSTGRDLDNIRKYLPALVHNQLAKDTAVNEQPNT